MMYDFDIFEITDEQKYLLCSNILHRDLLGVYNISDSLLSLHEHPYTLIRKIENLPDMQLEFVQPFVKPFDQPFAQQNPNSASG